MEHANWAVTLLLMTICGGILTRIASARRGRDIYIRRIPGLDAFEEALGRATEMGRPILFSPGFGDLGTMSTYAGLAVLEYVVRRSARFGLRVIVPIPYAAVFSLTQDTVRDAFTVEGRPDLYNPDDILFLSGDQNAFAAAVTGIMARDRVAAAFYFGSYGYESLLMAETGQRIGAIQVAATDQFFQVPFFLAACDYTMFGEELYASSAYLSREPTLLGSVAGQDTGKLVVVVVLLLGIATSLWTAFTDPGADGFNLVAGWLMR